MTDRPDDRAPDDRAPDDRAPDDRAPDDRAPDDRAPDDRAPDDDPRREPVDEASPDPVLLDDRYELVELLGAGGMSEVHRAHDRELDRTVAVKLLPRERQQDETDAHRLRQEARAAGALSHPHVVAVHDVGDSPHGVYVVMELLGGRPWADVLREHGRQRDEEVARVGAALASALAHAHEHGIVHRDVNPANVIVLDDGTPTLTDFGVAKLDDVAGPTETGRVVGTAAYMSPEQVRAEELDGRSDVYSLGCTLYEMLTGSTPFRGRGSADVAAARLREPPPPPRQIAPGISVALEDVVLRSLSRERRDRPDAARLAELLDELAERLAPGRATEVIAARPAPPAEQQRIPEPPASSPVLRRAGVALVVLGLLALVVVTLLSVL